MNGARVILAVLLAIAMLGAGAGKVIRSTTMVESARHLGFSTRTYTAIGMLEIASAAGFLLGVWKPVIGAVAATGVALLLIGAVVFHRRAGDGRKELAPPLVLAALAAITAVLMIAAS